MLKHCQLNKAPKKCQKVLSFSVVAKPVCGQVCKKMERWQNKVAVVTGASSGIGAACVKLLVAKGMIVVGLARRHERMENELKASLPQDQQTRFHALQCDVSLEQDILKAFKWVEEKLGGVDVLINNAGIVRHIQLVGENNTADMKATLDVNVLGFALCTREAFHSMKKRGVDGHVVLINSIAGHRVLQAQGGSINMYSPSKYAVTAMTEVLRQEFLLNGTKVKVTSVSPGLVETEIIGDKSQLPADIPILKSEDIADAVLYCIQTPPHVQIHELTIKPVGETL